MLDALNLTVYILTFYTSSYVIKNNMCNMSHEELNKISCAAVCIAHASQVKNNTFYSMYYLIFISSMLSFLFQFFHFSFLN